MTDIGNTVKSVERAVASSDHNFSDVYANIVALQQSSGDMRQFQSDMDRANRELSRRGLNDLDHDGKPDFVLVGATDGMIITADPTRDVLQARDKQFNVVKERAATGQRSGADQPPPSGQRPGADQPPPTGQRPGADQPPPTGQRPGADRPPPPGQRPGADQPPGNTEQAGIKQWGNRQFDVKEDGSATYQVKAGDTLWSISQDVLRSKLGREPNNNELNEQINAIAAASNISNPNLIRADMDVLKIPKSTPDSGSNSNADSDATEAQGQSRQADQQKVNDGNEQRTTNMKGVEVGGYAFPVVGYSERTVPLHHGTSHGGSDLFAPRGTPVVAFKGGTVEYVGNDPIGGNNVLIRQDDGEEAYYAHMDQTPLVAKGQRIATGQQIGVVGDTGNAKGTGTHLHFGVGDSINNGTGPEGGVGKGIDAVALLNQVLQNTRNQARA